MLRQLRLSPDAHGHAWAGTALDGHAPAALQALRLCASVPLRS